jgi:syntaxin 1B/2/3
MIHMEMTNKAMAVAAATTQSSREDTVRNTHGYVFSQGSNVTSFTEMSAMQNGQGALTGPTAILNKCKEINDGIQDLRVKREGQLALAQSALLGSSTGKEDQSARQTLDYIEDEINNTFRYLRDLMKKIKQTPGSGDSRVQTQIDVTSRNLRREIEFYQKSQSEFQRKLKEDVRRRYEMANPNATPDQIEQGVQNVLLGQEQTFQV